MNPTDSSSSPRYDLLAEAAQILEAELSFFSDCYFSDSDKEDNKNSKKEELEREIMFLRSSIDYFYANRVYPFAFRCATEDFCTVYVPEPMSPEEYLAENEMLWNRYKKRVWKICRKLEPLEDPREQHAFHLGNKIWGSMSLDVMEQDYQEDEETLFSAEEFEGGILDKYRFLKSAFEFKSKDDEDDYDEGKKKKLQIEELKRFVAKTDIIRRKVMTLLDDLKSQI